MASRRGIRYLIAGACNTLFGICTTLAITRLFLVLVPSRAKLMGTAAMLFASFFCIAFSFLNYKWFVFRTKGNYLREYMRSLLVYLPGIAINTLAVAPLSAVFNFVNEPIEGLTKINGGSVYLASVLLLGTTFILSFYGHMHVSFRNGAIDPQDAPQIAEGEGRPPDR